MIVGDSDDSSQESMNVVFSPDTYFDIPLPWRDETERLAYLECIRTSPPPLPVGDPFDDLIGNEIFDRLAAFLEIVAPCEIRLFMRQGKRMVYHVRPHQQEYLPLIKDVIVAAREFRDSLDLDPDDVRLDDHYIRISVPR